MESKGIIKCIYRFIYLFIYLVFSINNANMLILAAERNTLSYSTNITKLNLTIRNICKYVREFKLPFSKSKNTF